MAVPMVLAFALVLSVLGMFIMRNTRQSNQQTRTSFSQLQAHFVARAGMQHALLKVKYLQRELYDAACLAQGRNLLYDFTQIDPVSNFDGISEYNPGPIFLYRNGEATTDGFFTTDINTRIPESQYWLTEFVRDMCSGDTIDGQNLNMCMTMQPIPNAIYSLMREPFGAQYRVTAINLVANNTAEAIAAQVKNQAIVELTVEAIVKSARDEDWSQEIRHTVKVSRD